MERLIDITVESVIDLRGIHTIPRLHLRSAGSEPEHAMQFLIVAPLIALAYREAA